MLNLNSNVTQVLKVDKDLNNAHQLFSKALESIGKLKDAEYVESGVVLKGKSRYGLQSVTLEVILTSKENNTVEATINGKVMDVDGAAAQKCVQRLIEAFRTYEQNNEEQIQELEEVPAFKRKTGFTVWGLNAIVAVFVIWLLIAQSGSSKPSYYGKYRPATDNPILKDALESQDVYIELDKSGLIFYHSALSGFPLIENTGNYMVEDGQIKVEWANG